MAGSLFAACSRILQGYPKVISHAESVARGCDRAVSARTMFAFV
jgi:hypothetical protein